MTAKADFGHRTLVGTFDPTASDSDPTRTYFGLSLSITWFYLNFRDSDGKLHFAYRGVLGLEGGVATHGNLLRVPVMAHCAR